MSKSCGGPAAAPVRALVYEKRPTDGTPYCGEFWLAAVPSVDAQINIVKRGCQAATGGKIVEVRFFGEPIDKPGASAPIAVTFKR